MYRRYDREVSVVTKATPCNIWPCVGQAGNRRAASWHRSSMAGVCTSSILKLLFPFPETYSMLRFLLTALSGGNSNFEPNLDADRYGSEAYDA